MNFKFFCSKNLKFSEIFEIFPKFFRKIYFFLRKFQMFSNKFKTKTTESAFKETSISKKKAPSPKKSAPETSAEKSTKDWTSNTIFVGNIPMGTSEDDIRAIFSCFGKIASIRFRNLAANPEAEKEAKIALKTSRDLKKAEFTVKSTEKDAPKIAQKVFNFDENCSVYIKFVSEEAYEAANAAAGTIKFGAHFLSISPAVNNEESFKFNTKKTVYFTNLKNDVSEQILWEKINEILEKDAVLRIRIVREKLTRKSKGFGFIELKDRDDAKKLAAKESVWFGDRKMKMRRYRDEAVPREEFEKQKVERKKAAAERKNKKTVS